MHPDLESPSGHDWFAVQVRVGCEPRSGRELCLRGCEVFLPTYRESRRWSDRVKTIDRALFPGYLFCQFHSEISRKVVTTPGVIRILADSNAPSPIPAREIETIRRIVDTRLHAEPWPFLKAGHRVRVERGPLRGAEGAVLMVKNGHRLVVSIPLLQRSVAVEIDLDWVSVPYQSLISAELNASV